MALNLEAATADDLMHRALSRLLAENHHLAPPPTKGPCVEVTSAVLELRDPGTRVSLSVTRGRLFSALGELGWYLSGSGRTEHIAHYLSYYDAVDEDGEVHGAYGPRLRSFDGVDQLALVIDLLERKPSTRQAVIQLYDHTDLVGAHLDIPCTCTLQFLLRDDHLQLIVYMRSNDAFIGLPHDLFCFTMLQEIVARRLGAQLGTYTHIAGSLHLYDENRQKAETFVGEGFQSTQVRMPAMPEGDPFPALDLLLTAERALRMGTPWQEVSMPSDPYWGDLARAYAVFQRRHGPLSELELLRDSMRHNFYEPFVQHFIDNYREG